MDKMLRVIPDGEPCEAGFLASLSEKKFLYNNHIVLERFGKHDYGDGRKVACLDLNGEEAYLSEETIVQPVRLVETDVLDRILEMLNPGKELPYANPSPSTLEHQTRTWARRFWQYRSEIYAEAKAIIEEATHGDA